MQNGNGAADCLLPSQGNTRTHACSTKQMTKSTAFCHPEITWLIHRPAPESVSYPNTPRMRAAFVSCVRSASCAARGDKPEAQAGACAGTRLGTSGARPGPAPPAARRGLPPSRRQRGSIVSRGRTVRARTQMQRRDGEQHGRRTRVRGDDACSALPRRARQPAGKGLPLLPLVCSRNLPARVPRSLLLKGGRPAFHTGRLSSSAAVLVRSFGRWWWEGMLRWKRCRPCACLLALHRDSLELGAVVLLSESKCRVNLHLLVLVTVKYHLLQLGAGSKNTVELRSMVLKKINPPPCMLSSTKSLLTIFN